MDKEKQNEQRIDELETQLVSWWNNSMDSLYSIVGKYYEDETDPRKSRKLRKLLVRLLKLQEYGNERLYKEFTK